MKVIIAGAGIGGLSAAIALQKDGHEVVSFDRVKEMRPIGAAISGASSRFPFPHTPFAEMRCACSLVERRKVPEGVRAGPYAVRGADGPHGVSQARHGRDFH